VIEYTSFRPHAISRLRSPTQREAPQGDPTLYSVNSSDTYERGVTDSIMELPSRYESGELLPFNEKGPGCPGPLPVGDVKCASGQHPASNA
jgi:hypothetical protein